MAIGDWDVLNGIFMELKIIKRSGVGFHRKVSLTAVKRDIYRSKLIKAYRSFRGDRVNTTVSGSV